MSTVALLIAAIVAATSCNPFVPLSVPSGGATPIDSSAERQPILFIPGWAIGCINGGAEEWVVWLDEMHQRGYERDEWSVLKYDACAPNVETAALVEQSIDALLAATDAERVNVVAISMGNMSVRWCIHAGGCMEKVDHYVSLAGTNHGTAWAGACPLQFWSQNCADMQYGSPFLTELNRGDETPGAISYATYNSWCDGVVLPHSSTFLEGAENHDVSRCVGHDGWRYDRVTVIEVLDTFDADNR